MEEHERVAERAERELEGLEQRTEALGEEIAEARGTYTDDAASGETKLEREVEGAVGEHPEEADEPEATGPPQGWA